MIHDFEQYLNAVINARICAITLRQPHVNNDVVNGESAETVGRATGQAHLSSMVMTY